VVRPESKRSVVALQDGTTVLTVGGTPGAAFEPRVWEVSAEVVALFDEDRVPVAKELMESSLEAFDDHWILHYNLACAEARLGEAEAAFEHLRTALERRPQLAENAKDDPDLGSLRGDARFDELLGAVTSG
jgi:tetratricopeptide (TPR) repeat protein